MLSPSSFALSQIFLTAALSGTIRKVALDAQGWIDRYAAALGVEGLSKAEVDDLLGLAGTAAHASERPAAPLSCWLAAKAGISPAEALAVARDLEEASANSKDPS